MTHDFLTEELQAPSIGAMFLPLIGSLLVTGAVAALVCQPPAHALPLQVLVALAAAYIILAGLSHAVAVWLVRHLFQDYLPWPTETLIVGLWSTVAWLPLLTLLTSQSSLWVAATLPLITNCAVRFLERSYSEPTSHESETSLPFLPNDGLPFWRALLPSALASATLEGGVLSLLLQHSWLAGILFAGSLSLPVWKLVRAPGMVDCEPRPARIRKLIRDAFAAWVLTTIALVPFANSGLLATTFLRSGAKARFAVLSPKLPRKALADGKGALQFVVLLQSPRPREKRVAPSSEMLTNHGAPTAPMIIPFDGPYWFFKHAGDRPGAKARQERGDPRKVTIRSTDGLPMLMEAHQAFAPSIMLASSRTLRLELTNADDRPGVIFAEVVLEGHLDGKAAPISLGTLALPSSKATNIPLGRAPVQESLSFPLPIDVRNRRVDAITVRFKPDSSRNLAAPMVAIRDFVLAP